MCVDCPHSALDHATAALGSIWRSHRVVHGVLLGGKEDFFIQTALPEQDVCSAAPKDDEAGAVEWQQGFKVCTRVCKPALCVNQTRIFK